jgi:outer membrane lipoprotein-sorting protein
MHDAYAGRWFRTLTFSQRTVQRRPDGTEQVSTWYEAMQSPDRLRIDFGSPREGNGVLYTADSVYVVRDGKVVRSLPQGNVFLPFVGGAYTQPLERTVAQLRPYNFDLTRIHEDTWQGQHVWVVGSSSASDLDSPQFWVDADRLIVLRVLAPLFQNAKSKSQDIHLDDYARVGASWVATKIAMYDGDQLRQSEEYSDWRVDVPIPADFFVAEKWRDVPHWTEGGRQ